MRSFLALTLVCAPVAAAEAPPSPPRGTLYLAARPGRVVIADEATFRAVAEIPLPKTHPNPSNPLQLTRDRKRFISFAGNLEDIEVVDIASRKVVDSFRLGDGDGQMRFDGYAGGGESGRYLAVVARGAKKLVDRFEIGPKRILEYDLANRRMGRTIPWPKGEELESVGLSYSPDGKLLYVFSEDATIYDVERLEVVDTWAISKLGENGFGRVELDGNENGDTTWEEPGFTTGLFTVEDPVEHRKTLGVGRVDLAARTLDFWTVGPAQPMRALALAPSRKKAFSLLSEVGRYEIWTFDLDGRRLEKRTPFAGRPRMNLCVSSDGKLLYIYGAGNTIDVYEADTHRFVRTVTLDFEVTKLYAFPPGR